MRILKNSTSLLSSLDQLDVRTATSVQTFDFSTLYTSISHDLFKSRISNLVHNAFRKKDGSVRYTHIKVTRAKGYFTHGINGSGDRMYTADNTCKMIEFLIDNIFVQFGGRLFRQMTDHLESTSGVKLSIRSFNLFQIFVFFTQIRKKLCYICNMYQKRNYL